MQVFAENPDDPSRVLPASEGRDEIAVAGRHLSRMQEQLQKTLRQQKTLADLGLAVSKINHDMRNILASAQLMSDRLVDVEDPLVKSFAPKLLRTIDRAVGYTSEVLSYGQTSEAEPRRRRFLLAELCQEVRDLLYLSPETGIEFVDSVAADIEVDADSEQLFRVVHNICRNAVQALATFTPKIRTTCAGSRSRHSAPAPSLRLSLTTPDPACRTRRAKICSRRSAARHDQVAPASA